MLPNRAQFRLDPYTFAAQRQLSDCSNIAFKFPARAQSAPTLTLTTPASFADQTFTGPTYPVSVPVAGTWTDVDGNLNRYVIALRNANETADRILVDSRFVPTTSKAFATTVQIEQAGNWTVKLLAYDTTGFVTEADITVTITGAGGQVAVPYLLINGQRYQPVVPAAQSPWAGFVIDSGAYYALFPTADVVVPNDPSTLGPILFQCDTPAATIKVSPLIFLLGMSPVVAPPFGVYTVSIPFSNPSAHIQIAPAAPTGNEAHRLTSDIAVYHGWLVQGIAPGGSGLADSDYGIIVFQDWN